MLWESKSFSYFSSQSTWGWGYKAKSEYRDVPILEQANNPIVFTRV